MAKRKQARAGGPPREAGVPTSEPAREAATPAIAPPPIEPAPAPVEAPEEPPLGTPRRKLELALAGAVVGLGAMTYAPAEHPWPSLVSLARALALVAAGLAALQLFRRGPLLVRVAAPLVATLALMALFGRSELPGRPFAEVHPATFGVPTELALVLLGVGASLAKAARGAPTRLARGVLALGLGWSTLAFVAPDVVTTRTTFALFAGGHPVVVAGRAVLLGVLACAWVLALRRERTPVAVARVAAAAGPIAALVLGLGTLATGGGPLAAWLGAALIALVATTLERSIAAVSDASARDPRTLPRVALALEASVVAVVLALWLLLKTHALIASNTDENIYFYMAKMLGQGKLPYVDYFFAHPPLHVLVPGAFFAIFGYSLTFAKLFPLVASGLTGLGLWLIARRGFTPKRLATEPPTGLARAVGLVAMVFFLFAAEPLKASSNMTGVNMTTAWLVMGALAWFRGRPLTAGLLFGAAASTGFYAMAAICAFLALGLFRRLPAPAPRWRFALRQLAGFALVFGGLNLAFYAAAGDQFLIGVYGYHEKKAFQDPAMVELFGGAIGFPGSLFNNLSVMASGKALTKEYFYHPHLWLGALALPVLALATWLADPQRGRRVLAFLDPRRLAGDGLDGVAAVAWLAALALFVEFALFRELYSFYFVLIYPFLALASAHALIGGFGATARGIAPPAAPAAPARGAAKPARDAAPAPSRRHLVLAVGGVASALVIGYHPALAQSCQSVFGADELGSIGQRNAYAWTPAPVMAGLSDVVRALFWEDARVKGDVEPGYRHYLWTKKRGFETLDAIAAWIRAHTTEAETLAGSSTLAPLIALAADRRIAADEVDTNNKRFKTGVLSEEKYWNAICADRVKVIVASDRSYFTVDRMEHMPTAARWFDRAEVFQDDGLSYRGTFPITLYVRKGDGPCRFEPPRP